MDAIRRTSTLRRVATTASLAALLLPAAHADAKAHKAKKKAKSPVITSVSPLRATVGDTLTIKGRNFIKGKHRNSVGFKRAGAAVVFVRSDLSTTRTMTVKLSDKLEKVLGDGKPARFNLRVLSKRFGKQYTSVRLSPVIAPRSPDEGGPEPQPQPQPNCTVTNSDSADQDHDNLSDALEQKIGTDGCTADSDADGVTDGFEYRSAIDLNDDEFQNPNDALPYPGKRPYANPLDKDADVDHDGDGLTLDDEFRLWQSTTPEDQRTFADPTDGSATPLNYSDGMQYSQSHRCTTGDSAPGCGANDAGRRVPSLAANGYDKWASFLSWAQGKGYATIILHDQDWTGHTEGRFPYSILDVNRDGNVDGKEQFPLDRDGDKWLSDDERDEDADGLSNIVESHVEMLAKYWTSCYTQEAAYPRTFPEVDLTKADSDGDTVRDGADDQDFDDVPNMMELSRYDASGFLDTEDYQKDVATHHGTGPLCAPDADLGKPTDDPDTPVDESLQPFPLTHPDAYGQVNPYNPCEPDPDSRSCLHFFEGPLPAPFSGPRWWSLQ